MIQLKTLKWSNCFSYGEGNVLELDSNTVTQVIGTNGVGKSSIPLILEEVLFNKNSKGIKKADIANRFGSSGYTISLDLTKEDKDYNITVKRAATVKVVLTEDGNDISSHTATNTYKDIQKLIGIDFKTFSQLVYQNTSTGLQFLTATDSTRKKFLIDLLHLEEYVELFEIFKEASREHSSVLVSINSKVDTIQKWLDSNILADTNILPLSEIEFRNKDDETLIADLRIEFKNVSQKNLKIAANNQLIDMLEVARVEKSKYDGECRVPIPISKSSEYRDDIASTNQSIKSANTIVSKLKSLGDVCHVCEQSIDSSFKNRLIEEANHKLLKSEADLKVYKKTLKDALGLNTLLKAKKEADSLWEESFKSIDTSLPKNLVSKNSLESKINIAELELNKREEESKKLIKENEAITKRNTRIQVILEQTKEFTLELETLKGQLAEQDKVASTINILKKAFSTNGLLAYKIENLVVDLESLTNKYLSDLSDGRFTLEFVIHKDKLNVQITDKGNVIDITALSSGELARVNTATLIAIRRLMSSISNSKINVLFLDEVINVLDEVGRERLVEVLLKEEGLNTYVVSHGWSHPLLEKIEVIKEENISRIEI